MLEKILSPPSANLVLFSSLLIALINILDIIKRLAVNPSSLMLLTFNPMCGINLTFLFVLTQKVKGEALSEHLINWMSLPIRLQYCYLIIFTDIREQTQAPSVTSPDPKSAVNRQEAQDFSKKSHHHQSPTSHRQCGNPEA